MFLGLKTTAYIRLKHLKNKRSKSQKMQIHTLNQPMIDTGTPKQEENDNVHQVEAKVYPSAVARIPVWISILGRFHVSIIPHTLYG